MNADKFEAWISEWGQAFATQGNILIEVKRATTDCGMYLGNGQLDVLISYIGEDGPHTRISIMQDGRTSMESLRRID